MRQYATRLSPLTLWVVTAPLATAWSLLLTSDPSPTPTPGDAAAPLVTVLVMVLTLMATRSTAAAVRERVRQAVDPEIRYKEQISVACMVQRLTKTDVRERVSFVCSVVRGDVEAPREARRAARMMLWAYLGAADEFLRVTRKVHHSTMAASVAWMELEREVMAMTRVVDEFRERLSEIARQP